MQQDCVPPVLSTKPIWLIVASLICSLSSLPVWTLLWTGSDELGRPFVSGWVAYAVAITLQAVGMALAVKGIRRARRRRAIMAGRFALALDVLVIVFLSWVFLIPSLFFFFDSLLP
jgi:xanthine/uracil permease